MECMKCRREMEKRQEVVVGVSATVWVCEKCGRKVIDRESFLGRGMIPA